MKPRKPLPVFTNSSLTTFRDCRRKYHWRYNLRIVPDRKADALRIGGAYALGIEMMGNGMKIDEVILNISQRYSEYPDWCVDEESRYKYDIESATVCALLRAWAWRYSEEKINVIKSEMVVEQTFKVAGRLVILKGKIDQIAEQLLKPWLKEFKTAGEDISDNARIWLRMRNAPQTTIYTLLLMGSEFENLNIMYDYIRKPEIGPVKIPLLDGDGVKIVLDAEGQRVRTKDGKKWRESADKEAGYVLQTRPETPKEFHDRLLADMQSRPEYYFNRREVYREEKEIELVAEEVRDQIADILACEKNGRWYRNPGRDCDFCQFAGPCLDGWTPSEDEQVPPGFVISDSQHPELEEVKNDSAN